MTDISLTVNGITFVFQSSDVKKVVSDIVGSPTQTARSNAGPMTTDVFDYDGVSKVITVEGVLTEASTTRISGYSVTTILAQKQWLESVLNGAQRVMEFESNYESQSVLSSTSATPPYLGSFTSTKLMSGRARFEEDVDTPLRLKFTLTLLVGNGI
jgi:hypothetical protein